MCATSRSSFVVNYHSRSTPSMPLKHPHAPGVAVRVAVLHAHQTARRHRAIVNRASRTLRLDRYRIVRHRMLLLLPVAPFVRGASSRDVRDLRAHLAVVKIERIRNRNRLSRGVRAYFYLMYLNGIALAGAGHAPLRHLLFSSQGIRLRFVHRSLQGVCRLWLQS